MRSQAQARTHSSPEPPRCRAAQLLVQQAPLHIERLILLDAVLLETGESFALNHIGWPAQVRRPRRRRLCNVSAVLGQPAQLPPDKAACAEESDDVAAALGWPARVAARALQESAWQRGLPCMHAFCALAACRALASHCIHSVVPREVSMGISASCERSRC